MHSKLTASLFIDQLVLLPKNVVDAPFCVERVVAGPARGSVKLPGSTICKRQAGNYQYTIPPIGAYLPKYSIYSVD